MPTVSRTTSQYLPESAGIGIVHIGLGAFHRAHQAFYIERWLSLNGGGDWAICAANIRSNERLVAQLAAQHNRYHVVAYRDSRHAEVTTVQSIREALFAGRDQSALLDRLARPQTRIVSLTVTEKAYYLSPASGELDLDAPEIVYDRRHPTVPATVPGLLVAALRLRRERSLPPFTVLCCDNMPHNGERTRAAVSTLAAQQSAELADWISTEVPFPSSMVDRIVPAVTAGMRADMDRLIGEPDPAAVSCEAFSQWVIEDRFVAGRPDWERVGVEMVADVAPFETLKLRMLNGAHSLLAYVGLRCGKTTVSEAIADPGLNALLREYFIEAAATLDPTPGIDHRRYAAQLLDRFANDALKHQLSQIAMDGSQKLPQRWLQGAQSNLAAGRPIRATAIGIVAWLAHVRGCDDDGDSWPVYDPLAARLTACRQAAASAENAVAALLAVREVFPRDLAGHPAFRDAVLDACQRSRHGFAALLQP